MRTMAFKYLAHRALAELHSPDNATWLLGLLLFPDGESRVINEHGPLAQFRWRVSEAGIDCYVRVDF